MFHGYLHPAPRMKNALIHEASRNRPYWHRRNGLIGSSSMKFRTDPNDKTGYLIYEGFSPQKSIRKLRQIMKGELK